MNRVTTRELTNVSGKRMLRWIMGLIMLLVIAAPVFAYAVEDQAKLTVQQAFSNPSASLVDDTFTYRLQPVGVGSPLPSGGIGGGLDGYTFTIAGNSSFVIEPIGFTQPGIFHYKLFQVIPLDKNGYLYDERVYTIEAHVSSSINVSFIVLNAEGEKTDSLSFHNEYRETPGAPEDLPEDITGSNTSGATSTSPGGPKAGPKTGDNTNLPLLFALFTCGGILAASAVVYLIGSRRKRGDGKNSKVERGLEYEEA
ncbi:MAG: hypothetical protein FWF91_07200 [Coriobacteriia bacterium]|nr:hypothetical protein [Coriobacteriia bacterium]